MSNPIRMTLLAPLCVCCSLLTHSPSSLAGPLWPPELHMPGAKFGGTYRRVLHNSPSTLDPAFSTDIYGGAVVRQIFGGLVQFDAQLRPLPAIAKFWEASRDRRTWTFTLRRGVTFHHGREVTAHDFVYSFTHLLRVRSPTSVTDFFEHIQGAKEFMRGQTPHIEGLKAVDRYTLQIVLEEPLAPALAVLGLAHAAVVPQEEMERFNTQRKPFDDKRVRQAFNYAVNTEAIVREITRMGNLPATGGLPPGILGYDPDRLGLPSHAKGYSYHPEKAKRLLAEAGYPEGAGFPVVQLWSVAKRESAKAELTAYQRFLAELGVTVEIHFAPDWPTFQNMLAQGQLPMFRLEWFADIPDQDNMLSPLLHSASPTNRTFYRNPLVDQLMEQARKELDEAQRIALYRQVERIVMEDAPWIAQHHSVLNYLYQPYVQGVEINLLGRRTMPMKKIWFEKSLTGSSMRGTTDVQPSR